MLRIQLLYGIRNVFKYHNFVVNYFSRDLLWSHIQLCSNLQYCNRDVLLQQGCLEGCSHLHMCDVLSPTYFADDYQTGSTTFEYMQTNLGSEVTMHCNIVISVQYVMKQWDS